MLNQIRTELIRNYGRGRESMKVLAHKSGVKLRSLYHLAEGKGGSIATLQAVMPHLPAASQSRVMATVGLSCEPMTGPNYSIGEAAAGVAAFNSDYVESLADGRIDCTEERRLRDKAHRVVQALRGWLRRKT